MKQYYSVENFKAINYSDEILSIPVTLNKCAINNILVILDRWSISFNCIEYIVFDSNAQEQLILYISYEKKNGVTITYKNKKTNYIVLIHAFINRDMENQISFNTYERYDEMYAPLFYNEYKQLFYNDYFIGE